MKDNLRCMKDKLRYMKDIWGYIERIYNNGIRLPGNHRVYKKAVQSHAQVNVLSGYLAN